MPIEVEGGALRAYSQEEFQGVDYAVMGIVFDVHNQFGRFLDELLYKREVAARCLMAGIPTEREVRVKVEHGSFRKEYQIDLVIARGIICELKTVDRIAPAHVAQALNYLLLTGTHHGKLINLRPERVQCRFVSTHLTNELRKRIEIDDSRWNAVNDHSRVLKELLVDLLKDWGAFLECNLYREGLTHLLGGEANVVRRMTIHSDQRLVGEQTVHLVAEDTAFALTSVSESLEGMELHLSRFLAHTPLNHLQWINLNQHQISMVTLTK